MCANAPIFFDDNVMFTPGVTMSNSDHRIDVKGKYISNVGEANKLPENDLPIVLKGDTTGSAPM